MQKFVEHLGVENLSYRAIRNSVHRETWVRRIQMFMDSRTSMKIVLRLTARSGRSRRNAVQGKEQGWRKAFCKRSSRCHAATARKIRFSAEGTAIPPKTCRVQVLSREGAEIDRSPRNAHELQHATGATRRPVLDLQSRCGVGRDSRPLRLLFYCYRSKPSASPLHQLATGGAPVTHVLSEQRLAIQLRPPWR
jgi:hypothetical protein